MQLPQLVLGTSPTKINFPVVKIIRHDKDLRGRMKENITALLLEGIQNLNCHLPVKIISNETEALKWVIEKAPENAFIVTCTEEAKKSISFLRHLQKSEAVLN